MLSSKHELKYNYLKELIELTRQQNFIKDYGSYFSEHNVITFGGQRQSGKTTAMKRLFDVNKDIYISVRMLVTDEFIKDSYSLNNSNVFYHTWGRDAIKIMKDRKCIFPYNVKSLKERLLMTLKEDSVIYFDVWSTEIPDNHKHVRVILDIFEEFRKSDYIDVSKNILVYT